MIRKSQRLAEGKNCRIFPKDMIVEILLKKCPREEHGLWTEDIKAIDTLIEADDDDSVY